MRATELLNRLVRTPWKFYRDVHAAADIFRAFRRVQ